MSHLIWPFTVSKFNYFHFWQDCRLVSVEDVRNYFSHIIHILNFDFFLNFLLFVGLQTPTSRCWNEVQRYLRGK